MGERNTKNLVNLSSKADRLAGTVKPSPLGGKLASLLVHNYLKQATHTGQVKVKARKRGRGREGEGLREGEQ